VSTLTFLSGQGHNDEDTTPYLLPIPTLNRFYARRTLDAEHASCYPFHAACWTILEDAAPENLLVDNIEPLFRIFEGCHYYKKARALSWGHNYYLEDMLESANNKHSQLDFVMACTDNSTILADPLLFNFKAVALVPEAEDQAYSLRDHSRLLSLPTKLIHSIMYYLSFSDNIHLLQAYKRNHGYLPLKYWKSRFRACNEAGSVSNSVTVS
jgi:hypothetical protein